MSFRILTSTNLLLREFADDLNVSTPEIKQSRVVAEIEHFGEMISWKASMFVNIV